MKVLIATFIAATLCVSLQSQIGGSRDSAKQGLPLTQAQVAQLPLTTRLVACRSEFVTANAAGGVRVFPLDGTSIGGVGVDVAAEFASQVGNRREDAAGDDLAFDLGEPDLDLVEPGRVRGREVKADARMLLEELADGLSFVGGEIVEDDVNLLPRRAQGDDLLQKGDELAAGMAGGGFAVDATGGGIERGIQGERSVAIVLEAVAFGASRRERQDGIETIQGLNGGLLIDAEHGGVLRRAQIQAEDVGRLAFEIGIVAGHVAFADDAASDPLLAKRDAQRLC